MIEVCEDQSPDPFAATEKLQPIPEVVELLSQRIQDSPDNRITFAEFTDVSLYSEHGYYSSGRVDIGPGADFTTCPEMHEAFGFSVANAVHKTWEASGRPEPFDIIEMGAGNGKLAKDILTKLEQAYPMLYERTRYTIIERSPGLIARQQQSLQDMPVRWVNASADALPFHVDNAFFLSNELPDAFPAHRVIRRGDILLEIYVSQNDEGEFIQVEGELSLAVAGTVSIDDVPDGAEFTTRPMVARWQKSLSSVMKSGHVLTIDYGIEDGVADPAKYAPRIYPISKNGIENAYLFPGAVDITVSLDFEHMKRAGEQAGLRELYRGSQAEFLKLHGFDEEAERLTKADENLALDIKEKRMRKHQLRRLTRLASFMVSLQQKT
ncbi:MAG TPA: SAM-dependent methyltransferase [Verrucomicrobiae bacterium]|nr:SAM-dependent methyltransferase [Verrucomicrobiae bacterium]